MTHVALRGDIQQLLDRAAEGDEVAWSRLYGTGSAYLRAGVPVPEQLASALAERLNALSLALRARPKDVRAVLMDAVLPTTSPRPRAPKAHKAKALDVVAHLARDLIELGDVRRDLVVELSARYGVNKDSLDREIGKLLRISREGLP